MDTNIGLQTLAKDFFILSSEMVKDLSIEGEFLQPIAHSIAPIDSPVIDESFVSQSYLFSCDRSKKELTNTHALAYIRKGENAKVRIRGHEDKVVGYQNKPRMISANRRNWYDVKSELRKRRRAPIFLPRIVHNNYRAVWNQANIVGGDVVIEAIPRIPELDIRISLAVLNSTYAEVLILGNAQLYGGGVYSIGLAEIKELLIPDLDKLSFDHKELLVSSYQSFLSSNNRDVIDDAVYKILGVSDEKFKAAARYLGSMSSGPKK